MSKVTEGSCRVQSFLDKLQRAWERSGSLLCVGLDPNLEMLPAPFAWAASADSAGKARAVLEFCIRIIDAVHHFVCAFKPQYACFAALGPEGFSALRDVICHVRRVSPELLVILDAGGYRGYVADVCRRSLRCAWC
jgi:orotidine-5'-phosphate decarboxylase